VPVLGKTVFEIIVAIAGTALGMLLAVYVLGMLLPRANMPGVLIGLAGGLVCLALVWVLTEIPKWWFGAFTIVPTFVVGAVASIAFAPPPASALQDTLLKRSKE
jgi:Na+/proline symporter